MPIMGGIEGTMRLREMQRQGFMDHSVKIVLMTGDETVVNENEV